MTTDASILQFTGGCRWLSNFAPVSISLQGIKYPSVEHAYMSAKSDLEAWKTFCKDPFHSAGTVKRASYEFNPLPQEWHDTKKVLVMRECLQQKFSQEPYLWMLKQTRGIFLQEGNYHNDTFWGFCLKTNTGENNLGKMIMEIRDHILENGPYPLPVTLTHITLDEP
jgi:ribA/ribD-fused uncharacterized protein